MLSALDAVLPMQPAGVQYSPTTRVSGVADHYATGDEDALAITRNIVENFVKRRDPPFEGRFRAIQTLANQQRIAWRPLSLHPPCWYARGPQI